jgi:hypothetical protein
MSANHPSHQSNGYLSSGRPQLETRRSVGALTRSHIEQARFRIDGLSCAFDAARLEHRLGRQVGVVGVHVNPITDRVHVAYDPVLTSPSLLARQMEFSGCRARVL